MGREGRERLRQQAARERRADGVRSLRFPKGLDSRAQMKRVSLTSKKGTPSLRQSMHRRGLGEERS